MKKFTIVASTFVWAFSCFAAPGDLFESTEKRILDGVAACGLQTVSGQDPALDYKVRMRNVDYVIVKVENGYVIPGVLVDRIQLHHGDWIGDVRINFQRTNGSNLMNLIRDYNFNDFAVETYNGGRVAYSNTYWHGAELLTRFYVRPVNEDGKIGGQVEVGPDAFVDYVNTQVADSFVDMVCREAEHLK